MEGWRPLGRLLFKNRANDVKEKKTLMVGLSVVLMSVAGIFVPVELVAEIISLWN